MTTPHDNPASDDDREPPPADPFADAPIIFRYTRQQALADGVLVDLTEWAKEVGFIVPVACTAELWHRYIVPPESTRPLGQSERGRGHDLLWVLRCGIQRVAGQAEVLRFRVIFTMSPSRRDTVELKAVSGPGDRGEPVVTVMLPHED